MAFYKDYKFWLGLIPIIISLGCLIVAIISLNTSFNLNLEMKELKIDFIETIDLISPNATIENINGVKCLIFQSGGKICSGD